MTLTATISPNFTAGIQATGTVTFADGSTGTGLGSANVGGNGKATFVTASPLAAGSHNIVALYNGDNNFNGSDNTAAPPALTVTSATATTATTITVTANPPQDPSPLGQPITFTATVAPTAGSGTPSGTVAFVDLTNGGSAIVNLANGQASVSPSFSTSGARTLQASYSGDNNFKGSTTTLAHTVSKADPAITVTSSANPSNPGQTVTFTAAVSGPGTNPTGTVTFLDGSNAIGTGTLAPTGTGAAQATFTTSTLASGSHTITASYSGDSNYNSKTTPLTGNPQVVNSSTKTGTTTTVASSKNPSNFGDQVTFTATVSPSSGSGTPSGTVTFLDGSNSLGTGTLDSSGHATFITSTLPAGSHTITASYGGDNTFAPSTGSLPGNPQVVNKTNTTMTLSSLPNPSVGSQKVTFTATVSPATGSGTPTGTVNFLDGGTQIGSVTLSGGMAVFVTSTLTVGNHPITTSYNGDGNFNGSTASMSVSPQVVNQAGTTTTVTSSPNPSVFGQSVTVTATVAVSPVAPGSGTPTGTVTFAGVGGSPSPVTLDSNGQATFTTSTLLVGTHTFTVIYNGDSNFGGSTGKNTGNPQVVNKADTTTTVTSSQNPSALSQSVTFTATVAPVAPGAGTPTGQVTFKDGVTTLGTVSLNSSGVATLPTSSLTAGSHSITASYVGDGNFNVSTSAALAQTVNKADTTTTVTSSLNPTTFGQPVTFTATVSPSSGSGAPTGQVTFTANGTQIGSPVTLTTVSGTQQASITTSTLAVGSDSIVATYSGDTNFNNSASAALTQNVGKAGTTTSLTSSLNPSAFGFFVTFTATVSGTGGNPTGTVTFLDGGNSIGTGTLSGGQATFATSTLTAGNHTITANYGGDSNFNASTGSLTGNPQVVSKVTTTTAVTSSANPSVSGQSVTFTATVTPAAGTGTATGTVTFLADGSTFGTGTLNSSGVATISTAALGAFVHSITATYNGDTNLIGSTGSLNGNQFVNKAGTTTALTSSANPSTSGQAVTFTATVAPVAPGSGTPSGNVTFVDGGSTVLGTAPLGSNGQAAFTTSALNPGNHTITASYGGDTNFNASGGALAGNPQVVKFIAPTTISLGSLPQNGQLVTLEAFVFGSNGPFVPTGTVTFKDGGSTIGTGTLGASQGTFTEATFDTTALSVGSHTITATYPGNSNFTGNTGSFTLVIAKANTSTTVTSSNNPSGFGQSIAFTATVTLVGPGSGAPTGMVTFLDGGSTIGTGTLSGGAVTFTTSTLGIGNHSITANYGGDGNFSSSNGSLTGNPQVVTTGTSTTALTSSANPSAFGQSVTFTATVSGSSGGSPTGSVIFTDGSSTLGSGTLDNTGKATFPTSTLTPGSHTIKATYNGDTNFAGSNISLTQTVNQATSTTALTSSSPSSTFGQPVTFTATVSSSGGTPTGTVTFTDGSSTLGSGTLDNTGKATFPTSTLAPGNHTIKATYNGDSNFASSNASLTQTVNQATSTTALTSSSPSSTFGQPVTFTATVSSGSGTPTGTVTFTDGSSTIGSGPVTLSGGVATTTTAALAAGSHTIKATYNGDTNFAGSNASLSQTVNQVSSTTALTSSSPSSTFGQPVTFTATVSSSGGTPTGTVTFTDGSSTIGSGPVTLSGGVATISTAALAPGSHTIKATYNGDINFAGSSNSLTQTVNQATTSAALKSSQNPSAFGQSVTFTATISPSSGSGTPTGTVNFTVDGGAPTSVPLSNGQATFSTASLGPGSHSIAATYAGDTNFTGSNASLSQGVNQSTTTTALTSSPNPAKPGQSVTFTAAVHPGSGSGTPTGTVTFKDNGTTLGTGNIAAGTATYTTSALTLGSHSISAVYGGDTNFATSTSATLIKSVTNTTDSAKLRQLQIAAAPAITQNWAQSVTGAMTDAIAAGFGGNPQSLSPAGTGFTYYFTDDPPAAQPRAESDRDSLRQFLASPNSSAKRVDNGFRALGLTDPTDPTTPPPSTPAAASAAPAGPHNWLAWFTVRGTDISRNTVGNDLKGNQIDGIAGLTRRLTPDLVVGVLGGYERFDYSSQAFNGVLKGNGWTVGAYLGWKLSPNIRFDAGGAWAAIMANSTAGTASGNFTGTHWLASVGLTGTYPWEGLVFEPSARVFTLWEREKAFTDSLGTLQPAHNFETGRASGGVKVAYPFTWSSTANLTPYFGLYGDYYFSRDDAQTTVLTTVPLLHGWSARATGGVSATLPGGASLGAGGEFGGIGSVNHIWTWTARGHIPF